MNSPIISIPEKDSNFSNYSNINCQENLILTQISAITSIMYLPINFPPIRANKKNIG